MEEFEKIDWLPNVEDIIDDKFVDEERLKRESAMYSLMNGTFEDPFKDIRNPNYQLFRKQLLPKKTNTENNETPKKTNQNPANNEGTPNVKKQRGRPKKKKN